MLESGWGSRVKLIKFKGGGGAGGELKPDIVCRWERVFKNESLPLYPMHAH